MAVAPSVIVRKFPLTKGAAAMMTMVTMTENTVKMVAMMSNRGKIMMMGRIGTQLRAKGVAAMTEIKNAEGLGTATGAHTP